jgi:hypothetical protein
VGGKGKKRLESFYFVLLLFLLSCNIFYLSGWNERDPAHVDVRHRDAEGDRDQSTRTGGPLQLLLPEGTAPPLRANLRRQLGKRSAGIGVLSFFLSLFMI